jgi:hypothetical protein
VLVDGDAATEEMLCRRDRDALGHVDAVPFAFECEFREVAGEIEPGYVESDLAGLLASLFDRAGDDVPGCEFGVLVVLGHEPLAVPVS